MVLAISSLQKSRIQLILDEDMPSSYNENLCANIWEQWAPRFNVTFLVFDDDKVAAVRADDGSDLTNGELNKALALIIESIQSSKTKLHHVRSTDKIKSVTATAGNPNPASLEKYIKQLNPKVPLASLKSAYNQASQEIEEELKGKSPEEQLAHVHYLRFRAERAQEIYSANFAVVERKTRIKIDTVRKDAQTKRTKAPPKLSRAETKITEKNLSPMQIMMKASGRSDFLDTEAVIAYTKRYKAMMGEDESTEYVIETTKSETQTFGKRKEEK
jgi:hypothetical protein